MRVAHAHGSTGDEMLAENFMNNFKFTKFVKLKTHEIKALYSIVADYKTENL